jgi:AICAR transformylase/IMP cyclohydrolase PurH
MRALLSVYDKTGIIDFARGLTALGYQIVLPAAPSANSAPPAST